MKILFLGAHFPRPNNPTNGVWALAQVRALRAAGHDIEVISPVPAIPPWISSLVGRGSSARCPDHHCWGDIDVHYVRWPVYPVGLLAKYLRHAPSRLVAPAWALSAWKFVRIARHFKPDVIFAHHGQLAGYVGAQVARRLGKPFFITEHSFGEIESCAVNRHRWRHYQKTTRGISTWIAVANRMRDSMTANFPDVPSRTIHNGTDPIPRHMHDVPRPPELQGRIVVVFVGFLYARKRVPQLIDAFDRIAGDTPNATLVVIGDGEDRARVQERARSSRHRDQIQVLPGKSHGEVLQYMVWSDIVASVGVNEPFATVFSEAMMAGKPIIYSNDGGITDVVRSGVHGIGVPPDDVDAIATALRDLLKNAALRAQMGTEALKLASRQLTWSANAGQVAGLFAQGLSGA